jgi:hypothetical protein
MTVVVPELPPSPGFCDSAFASAQNDAWGLNRLSFSGLTRESTLLHVHLDTREPEREAFSHPKRKREYDTGGSELPPSPGFCDSAFASAQNDAWGLNRLSFSGLTRASPRQRYLCTRTLTFIVGILATSASMTRVVPELPPSPGFCDSAYGSAQNDGVLFTLIYIVYPLIQVLNIFF